MSNKDLIPNSKEDNKFIDRLKDKSIDDIKDVIPNLLEWMQDINWPQSGLLFDYFSPHINVIDNEIISILGGKDEQWKYSILLGLILNPSADIIPNDKILSAVQNLHDNATEDDIEEGNVELASEILKKYNFRGS